MRAIFPLELVDLQRSRVVIWSYIVASRRGQLVESRIVELDRPTWPDSSGFQVLQAGTHDGGLTKPAGWFAFFVPWALAVLDEPNQRLLVHCAMGSNRGPSGAFAILLMLGWTPGRALQSIQAQRPYAQIRYAEEACLWFHSVTAAPLAQRSADYAAISQWRTQLSGGIL